MLNGFRRAGFRVTRASFCGAFRLSLLLLFAGFTSLSAHAGVLLVQHASKDAGVTSSSSLAFPANNTAGNWIGVVIRAGHSGQTLTVSDTHGNIYRQALQSNETLDTPNGETLAIYYAENIAAGANTVTIAQSITNNTLRFAILEYSGIAAANSLDVMVAGQSSGTTFTSGNATTTVGGDLILGEVTSADGVTFTAGSGYAIQERVPAAPNTKLIVEDAVQLAAGTASVSATVSISNNGGAILAAFKAASVTPPPSITSLTPSSGPVGTAVAIAGANFGASQGTSTVTFGGVSAGTASSWGASSITMNVPSGATSGNVVVTVGGVASNGAAFTVLPTPNITSLSPASGPVGMWLFINGTNFGTTVGTVTFNGVLATSGGSWSPTNIQVAVPIGATTGNVVVTAGGVPSNGFLFTVTPAPVITTLSPTSGAFGTSVAVSGTGFGVTQGSGMVSFGGTVVTPTSWNLSTITFKIPNGATSGNVVITVGGQPSNGVAFTVLPISVSLTPPTANVIVNTSISLTPTVQNDVQNQGVTWSLSGVGCSGAGCGTLSCFTGSGSICYIAPSVVPSPPTVTVTATSIADPTKSATCTVTVVPATPSISSLNPTSGPINTLVTISGANLGSSQGLSTVTFNGVGAFTVTNWSSTTIVAAVPFGATTGNVVVTVGGAASNPLPFTVTPSSPNITSLTPGSGQVGTSVTIVGTGFSSIQGGSSVTFNGIGTNPTSWSNTSIVAPVPSFATSGNVVVTIGSVASNGINFSVIPNIVAISPAAGSTGAPITITGTGFGAAQGTSSVSFNGTSATPTSWSTTSIVVPVPAGSASGNLVVTVGGVASNPVPFTVLPVIVNLNPTSGTVGTSVTVNGSNFGATQGLSSITFNGIAIVPTSWSDTSIIAPVPAGANSGSVIVTVGGVASNAAPFTVIPSISSVAPASGPIGISVTIAGNAFGPTQGASTVTFNGVSATPTSWSATSITTPVPAGATSGNVVVTVGGVASNGVNFTVITAAANIALVQHGSKDAGVTSSSSLAFPSNNTAGNWIGVAIRAGHSGQTLTVSDTRGNTYRQAMQSNETLDGPNGETFAIYYAENISGGANTVTVAQSITNNTLRFAILEYSGVATSNSLDVIAAAQGTGTAPSSGNATTTTGGDLVLGMVVTANGSTMTAGTGFTIEERVPAAPNTKLIAEDEIKTVVGAVAANATLAASDNWGAGFAAFKAVPGGGGAGPNISNLNPASGSVGTPVTITGTNFGASQGTSTVTFNGTAATPTSWTATSIGVPVPTGATSGSVVVTVSGMASNGVAFNVTPSAPSITNLNPVSGPIGTPVTITGTNFGASQGTSTVTFNGVTATPTSWGATSIGVPVPAGATTGNVVVTVAGVASNGANFSVTSTAPSITNLNPTSGAVATPVTITGTNFGSSPGTSTVTFNGTAASPTTWNATTIIVPVPSGATSGNVVVTVGGVPSNGVNFTVTAPATNGIALVQHTSKDAGVVASSASLAFSSANTAGNFIAVVIRAGKAFQILAVSDSRGNTYHQAIQANLTVDGESAAIYYAESVVAGANTVTVGLSIPNNTLRLAILEYSGLAPSNSLDATVSSQGTDTSPSSGNATTTGVGELLIAEITNANGTTFGAGSGLTLEESVPAAPGSKLLVEDGIQPLPGVASGTASMAALDNWGAVLAAFKPASAGAGPHIVSVSPRTAPVGSQVTIAGTNFGSTQGASTVTFNGTPATSKTWSATSIVVTVPAGATSGNVVVTVGGTASNGFNFTVGFAPPISFVQAGSNQNVDAPLPTAQNFITVAFKGAQTTGNMNVVVVGWQDSSATVASVTDTVGHVYRLANNTVVSGTASLSVYYASDILPSPPNTNVVAVAFNGLATNGDVRIAEYAGLDPTNPLDVAVSGQGNGGVSNSNSVSTTNASDLLVGANEVFARSTAAGAGYTNRVISLNGGILEDQIVSATGSYSATTTLSGGGNWIMQMVAFKAPAAAAPGITIGVSPLTTNTPTGFGTQSFTATLQNDVQRLGVNWTLSGGGCSGSTCGSLSNITATSATYNAPANLPSPATVLLTATSVADTTKAAGATITVTQGALNVAISPKRAAVTLTQAQQFNATATNDPANAGVVWSVDGNNGGNAISGTISSSGLFTPGTAAGVHTITASSVSNASVNISATVAVTDLAGVFTYHYDSQSTGQNTKEYALTTSSVTPSTFGLLFNCPVDGFMFANPLYAANLTFGAQTHNVVFLATEHNSVYAFDADSPSCTQLWKTSFLSTGVTTVPPADTGDGVSLVVEFGITGTPVIDPATNTLYVVANTKETVGTGCSQATPCFFYRLHALDLLTGAEKFGGPVLVAAPNFIPLAHLQRPALLLNNGTVYIAFGSHADLNTYQGWVMAFNASTLAQNFAWSTTVPTGGNNQGAIWGSGNPPVADASGNIYVVTGNGAWDGSQNFSDSVVKLSSTGGVPPDYFTPFDQSTFNINDIDLGSSGAMVLPDAVGSATHPHVMIVTGKVGVIYLLDQTNLGKFHNGSNQDLGEVVLGFNLTSADNGFYGQPAYWNGNLYPVIVFDFLRQFPVSNATIASTASSVAPKLYPYRGATPSVSANGNTNGIVWIEDANPYLFNGPSILDAYDASRVATQLYSSPMTGAGAACSASKFIVPVVANGKVYISGSNCFSVFGLLPN